MYVCVFCLPVSVSAASNSVSRYAGGSEFDRRCGPFQWENHSKSLALEAHTRQKIVDRINQKVNDASGTWIDWQYLLGAYRGGAGGAARVAPCVCPRRLHSVCGAQTQSRVIKSVRAVTVVVTVAVTVAVTVTVTGCVSVV